MSTLKTGDRVYHRKLKMTGTYWHRCYGDPTLSRVEFNDDPDYLQGRIVSTHLLERAS